MIIIIIVVVVIVVVVIVVVVVVVVVVVTCLVSQDFCPGLQRSNKTKQNKTLLIMQFKLTWLVFISTGFDSHVHVPMTRRPTTWLFRWFTSVLGYF